MTLMCPVLQVLYAEGYSISLGKRFGQQFEFFAMGMNVEHSPFP